MSINVEANEKYQIIVSGGWIGEMSNLINEAKKPLLNAMHKLEALNNELSNGMTAGKGMEREFQALSDKLEKQDMETIKDIRLPTDEFLKVATSALGLSESTPVS